jgi:hypothetical protein
MTFDMPNIAYLLYKNPIFKIIRLWEHCHFLDNLGFSHLIYGKVIFDLSDFFLSLFIYLRGREKIKKKKKEKQKMKFKRIFKVKKNLTGLTSSTP